MLFVVSLFMPAFKGGNVSISGSIPGWGCLLLGWPFYVSNVALVVAPLLCWSRTWVRTRQITAVILLLSFAVTVILGVSDCEKWLSGYWLWCAAFLASGLAAANQEM